VVLLKPEKRRRRRRRRRKKRINIIIFSMFLRRPLTNGPIPKAENDEFCFGYPRNLHKGVRLVEKRDPGRIKVVHSLYELELGVKYGTDRGFTITRIAHDLIQVGVNGNMKTTNYNGHADSVDWRRFIIEHFANSSP
jgi:hypothetical protein